MIFLLEGGAYSLSEYLVNNIFIINLTFYYLNLAVQIIDAAAKTIEI